MGEPTLKAVVHHTFWLLSRQGQCTQHRKRRSGNVVPGGSALGPAEGPQPADQGDSRKAKQEEAGGWARGSLSRE